MCMCACPTDVVSKIGSQIMREKVAFKKTLSIFENFGLFTAFLRGGRFPLAPPPHRYLVEERSRSFSSFFLLPPSR